MKNTTKKMHRLDLLCLQTSATGELHRQFFSNSTIITLALIIHSYPSELLNFTIKDAGDLDPFCLLR